MEGVTTHTLDLYSEYCTKSDALALLILSLQDGPYSVHMQERIDKQRQELDALLDKMIGGECESANTGKA